MGVDADLLLTVLCAEVEAQPMKVRELVQLLDDGHTQSPHALDCASDGHRFEAFAFKQIDPPRGETPRDGARACRGACPRGVVFTRAADDDARIRRDRATACPGGYRGPNQGASRTTADRACCDAQLRDLRRPRRKVIERWDLRRAFDHYPIKGRAHENEEGATARHTTLQRRNRS